MRQSGSLDLSPGLGWHLRHPSSLALPVVQFCSGGKCALAIPVKVGEALLVKRVLAHVGPT